MASTRKDIPGGNTLRRASRQTTAKSARPFHFSSDVAAAPAQRREFRDAATRTDASDGLALRVLLVDDQPARRLALGEQVHCSLGKSVRMHAAASGRDAIATLRGRTFDLVLIERSLPDADGIALVEQLVEIDDRLAIIIVSDANDARLAARALRSGAADYLVRGQIDADTLARAAKSAIRAARLEEKNRRSVAHLRDVAETTDQYIRGLAHDMTASVMILDDSLRRVEDSCREAGITSDIRDEFAHVTACLEQSKRLADDLAGLAQSGALDTESRDVDVAGVVNKVVYEQAAAIDRRGIEVTVAAELGTAHCNANSLYRLVTNLVRNALVHGCDAHRPQLVIEPIETRPAGADRRVWLRIWDNGPGIPSDLREQIFEPGRRYGATAGSGMGLAIVRRIISRYDGTVMVDPACHEGTAIILSLPAGHGV